MTIVAFAVVAPASSVSTIQSSATVGALDGSPVASCVMQEAAVVSVDNRVGAAIIAGAPSAIATALALGAENVASVGGVLTIPASQANTFIFGMTENVTSIVFENWAVAGKSQRIVIYFKQDATGARTVQNWPSQILWPDGALPVLSPQALSIDCIVFDTFDGGASVIANLVGQGYGPA